MPVSLYIATVAELPIWQGVAIAIPCFTRSVSTSYTCLFFLVIFSTLSP